MSNKSTPRGKRGNGFVQFYRWVFGIGHERNVGGIERAVRYTLGAVFTLVGLVLLVVPVLGAPLKNAILSIGLIIGGLYLIYEARVQYCPLNHTFDRSTYAER